jgi:hypothetical protein
MNYADAVARTWRHSASPASALSPRDLVRYATLAASSHNTQPWRFEIGRGQIAIKPDFRRRCTAVDPDDHHLFASLGCAAENLVLAAAAAGLESDVRFEPATTSLRIALSQGKVHRSALFDAIVSRQCTRTEYDGSPLSTDELRLLEAAARGTGVDVVLLTSRDQKDAVAEYVAQGNTLQFADAAWANELQSWIRFSAREAIRTGDGLFGPVMGNPAVPRWIGRAFMRFAFSAAAQNRKDTRNIASSSAIAVIHSDANDAPHWIEAGRSYQRLALQAAALELKTAFINQPVEVSELRPQFAQYLGLGNRRPDLVVRIGRASAAPRSLRRPVDEVIERSER